MTRKNSVPFHLVAACCAATLVGGACSSSPSIAQPDPLICGTYSTYTSAGQAVPHTEWYVLSAINYKLGYYKDYAAAVGFNSVSTCAEARAYFAAEAAYAADHPGFDADLPLRPIPPAPAGAPEPDPAASQPPTLQVPKLANGAAGPDGPVVQVWEQVTSQSCTGAFIAKNWIATAAHCMVAGPNPRQTVSSAKKDSLFGDYPYIIRWFDPTGKAIPATGTASNPVFDDTAPQLNAATVTQYVDNRYEGPGAGLSPPDPTLWKLGQVTMPHGSFDFALLFLNPRLYDPVLPFSADNGSAMRLSLNPQPGPSDSFYGAGCGETSCNALNTGNFPLHSGNNASLAPFSLRSPDQLTATLPSGYSGPLLCEGDSGGPITRTFNVRSSNGTVSQAEALADVFSNTIPTSGDSANFCKRGTGDVEVWVRVDLELPFIEQSIGGGFHCQQMVDASDPTNGSYAQCWGPPCQTDCDCAQGQVCSRSGAYYNSAVGRPLNGCPACAFQSDQSCGCIVGQCVPGPAIGTPNMAPKGGSCSSSSSGM